MRLARPGEGKTISRIEARAAEAFREIGMDAIADAPPSPPAHYECAIRAGRVLLLEDRAGVCACLTWQSLDNHHFIEEVGVDPRAAGQGMGAALIAALPVPVSLSCFMDVPWNAPYYGRLGFAMADPAKLGPAHNAIAREETRRFAPWPRCIMVKAYNDGGSL